MNTEQTIPLKVLHADKLGGCAGCRDDFYNYTAEHSGCWSLPRAKLVWRWRLGFWTPMDRRENFTRVQVYDCWYNEGSERNVHLKRLPAHLGGDWADKDEQRAAEGGQS